MLRPATTPPHLATLIVLTSASILTLNMILPSLANIARDLQVDYAVASLAVSGFLAVNAGLQLVLGPVADKYGRRPVLLWAMGVFALASLVCATAESIWVFLAARTFQAVVIAASALSAAIISDTTERSKAASRMGYVAMAMAVAPMLAPMIGGFLDESFGWRSSFWVYTVLGMALLGLVWVDLGETNPKPAATFWRQMETYPVLLKSAHFWGFSACAAFGVGGFFVFISSAPLVGEEIYGLTPGAVGLGIGSITTGFFVGSFLSGRYSARQGINWMLIVGRAVAVIGVSTALVLILTGLGGVLVFFAGAISYGFANGLSIPNARAGALAIFPHLAGSASGLSGALTMAFGAAVTSLPGLLLTPENGAWATLVLMLVMSLGAFLSAIYVWWLDRAPVSAPQ